MCDFALFIVLLPRWLIGHAIAAMAIFVDAQFFAAVNLGFVATLTFARFLTVFALLKLVLVLVGALGLRVLLIGFVCPCRQADEAETHTKQQW